MARRSRGGLADIDYERLANKVAERVWSTNLDSMVTGTTITVGTSTADPLGPGVTVTDHTTITGDPNMFRVHDILQPAFPSRYEDGEPLTTDIYQSRILQLISRVEILETRLAEVSQLLVEHVKRSNPPVDRKRKRCVILDQEREVDEKVGV